MRESRKGPAFGSACGVGKTLMCHSPHIKYAHSSHSSHGKHKHHKKLPHTHCVKNKDVSKKLQKPEWALGPCPVTAKEELFEMEAAGLELTAQPNPFSETTIIKLKMTTSERVSLKVYNMSGVEVVNLFEGVADKDNLYQFEFKADNNPDGMYFYRLVTESGDVYIRKLVQAKQ